VFPVSNTAILEAKIQKIATVEIPRMVGKSTFITEWYSDQESHKVFYSVANPYRPAERLEVFMMVLSKNMNMKNNFKIITCGTLLLILGAILSQVPDYRYFLFDIYFDLQIIGILIISTLGLVVTGIGVMLEFTSRKYENPYRN
jgi:hypothetical protein